MAPSNCYERLKALRSEGVQYDQKMKAHRTDFPVGFSAFSGAANRRQNRIHPAITLAAINAQYEIRRLPPFVRSAAVSARGRLGLSELRRVYGVFASASLSGVVSWLSGHAIFRGARDQPPPAIAGGRARLCVEKGIAGVHGMRRVAAPPAIRASAWAIHLIPLARDSHGLNLSGST